MNSYTIITDKFAFGGKCVGKINGKTVFVPYALPGEKLEIEITQSKKDYDEGKILNIIEASPFRIQPVCPLYEKCGGCNMMHIEEKEEIKLKLQVLQDLFAKNSLNLPEISVLKGENTGYRSRFNLNDGSFSEKQSNKLVDISFCPIADKNVNDYFKNVPVNKRPHGRCNIFGSDLLDKKLVVAPIPQKTDISEELNFKKKNKNFKMTRKIYSGSQLDENFEGKVTLLGKEISFDVRGFFQSNMNVLEKAIQETVRGLSGKKVLDMYSGCGTFSVFLADLFEEVTLVEHNRDALVYAEKNLAGKKHVSWGMSGAKWVEALKLSKNQETFDAVVIDPPRSGMEKEVLKYLAESNIPQIRAVSCDPATQSRDIAYLVKAGYKIEKAFLLDFYPNTSHTESLLYLKK